LVPAKRESIQAFERMRTREYGLSGLRALFDRAGLPRLLYPALMVVARA
jgi:hypothetical protein